MIQHVFKKLKLLSKDSMKPLDIVLITVNGNIVDEGDSK